MVHEGTFIFLESAAAAGVEYDTAQYRIDFMIVDNWRVCFTLIIQLVMQQCVVSNVLFTYIHTYIHVNHRHVM